MIREQIKWWLFPGLNLNARLRFRALPKYFGRPTDAEKRTVLDAGCGNGMLAYQSYLLGNRVIGVSIKSEVERNRILFNKFLKIPEDQLCFRDLNLYKIDTLGEKVDEIICTEVMEHIRGDQEVCTHFFNLLKPGGTLHICCPNAEHPYHKRYPLDPDEKGGHVRPGYTMETYRKLLEPIGFNLSNPVGLGGNLTQFCNIPITEVQAMGGLFLGLPLFFLLAPLSMLDTKSPKVPFSLYVRASRAK